MASTSTTNLLLEKQGTGDNEGAWGGRLNTAIDMLDRAIAGTVDISTTGGDTELSDTAYTLDQAKGAILNVTGTLVSNATITVPSRSKTYIVRNQTTGSYTLTVKTSAGSGVTVDQGSIDLVVVNASDDECYILSPSIGTFSDGSAAAPSVTNTGDTDTGLYFSAADELSVATGGTQRVVVDSSGNVGIGTSSPSYALDVQASTGPVVQFQQTDSTTERAIARFMSQNNRVVEIRQPDTTDTNDPFVFYTGNAFTFRVDATDAVAISSNSNVSFASDVTVTGDINAADGSAAAPSITNTDDTNTGLYFSAADQLSVATGGAQRVVVDSNGNVGIGTSSPDNKLHVRVSDTSYTYTPNSVDVITLERQGFAGLNISTSNTGTSYIAFTDADDRAQGTIEYFHSSDAMAIDVNGSERLRIASDGKVGIGTTSPGFTLDIDGSLSKSSGSFKIPHPLPEKTATHWLVHSFVESPTADNIYRGKAVLSNGSTTIDLDAATGMTTGTFAALNGNTQAFIQNESGWSAVRGSVDNGTLTIECQNATSSDEVSWLVIGERQDPHMIETQWTDEYGRVTLEPERPIEPDTVGEEQAA